LSKPTSLRIRILRLSAFTLGISILFYLIVNIGLARLYVAALTHPGCNPKPTPVQNVTQPEEHIILTADGLHVRTWYYPPQNSAVVIVLGGPSGSLGQSLPPVDFLLRDGFGLIQVDSRACATPPASVTLGANELMDAEAALKFLQSRPEVKQIGAIGFSMGGVTAIRTAARHPDIAAVVAEGGYFNMGKDLVEPEQPKPLYLNVFLYTIAGFFQYQYGINPWEISPVDDLPRISPRPVLLIYGEYELHDGHGDIQFAAAREPKELWIVPGGAHGTNYQIAPQEYERRVLEFFNQALVSR
jgi:dipeptidyl aminopeptidase/acylaminoacyl peptidase